MKKILFILNFMLLNFNLVAQSKKEIIQILNNRIDSLNIEIINRDKKFEKELSTKSKDKELMLVNISKLEKKTDSLQESITLLKRKLSVFKDSIDILNNENKLFLSSVKDLGQEITIGTQVWQSINLDVTTYRDGTPIPQVTDPTQWANLTTGAWCYYDNNPSNGMIYGKLYNWYAVAGIHDTDPNTPNKVLAPAGWHVPFDIEWSALVNFLGGESTAGGKMKSTGTTLWNDPNTAATNSSGFTGLPGGLRSHNGLFSYIGIFSHWWSANSGGGRNLYHDNSSANKDSGDKRYGGFVRCVRDYTTSSSSN